MADRIGRQTPTESFVLPYQKTDGAEAIESYEKSGRTAMDWQKLLVYDMLAREDDGQWTHMKYGISVPRQNGKNEAVAIREMYGLLHGEKILHTAHRTDTSHTAWERLLDILSDAGLVKPDKKDKGLYRAFGKEHIYLDACMKGGGRIEFRTRTSKGGLGTSYDLLVIDEAQEYQDDQDAALKYTNSASENPQTIYLGTPPTVDSAGTLFTKLRKSALAAEAEYTGWSEWSVPQMCDPNDKDCWYETNPSLGIRLKERTISGETSGDAVDFNVQRLGLWLSYHQESAISKPEWEKLEVKTLPKLRGKLFIGIKYGKDGSNVALSIAVKTTEGKIFVEAIDCRPIRATNRWILDFLRKASWQEVVVERAKRAEPA
ncbi:MAG: terminase TerL endonuclease subunit [Anaerovoracaceae bacterium]